MKFFERMGFRFAGVLLVCSALALTSCGGGQQSPTNTGDQAELSSGVSPVLRDQAFGQPASPAEVEATAKLLSGYFDGSRAGAAGGLTGSTVAPNGAAALTKAMLQTSSVPKVVYRFYNTATGVHFYTLSEDEKAYVTANLASFQYEGQTFLAYPSSDPALSPVYRFYNKITGTHFYTVDEAEKAKVIATWANIFNYEGVAWYANKVTGDGWVPIYRFFNKTTGTHFYTPNESERANVIATLPQFTFEGVGYYVRVPSTAPSPMQMTVEKAVVKPTVIKSAEAFLTRIGTGNNFTSPAGRTWVVGQVFLHNGSAYKVTGFLTNADGTIEVSTQAVPLTEAYSDLKFKFKANSLVYDDNLQPLSAAQFAAKRAQALRQKSVSRKEAITGLQCLIPKVTERGNLTETGTEWGYAFELNNCSLNELFRIEGGALAGFTANGKLSVASAIEHEYDLSKSTNLTTISNSANIEMTASATLSQLARNRLKATRDVCKEVNGAIECEAKWPLAAARTILVGSVPITFQSGFGLRMTVDVHGSVTFSGKSGYIVSKGVVNGKSVNEKVPTASSFYVPAWGLEADGEADIFAYGFVEAGIGAEALDAEVYLAKVGLNGGVYGTAAFKVESPVCATYSGGGRVEGEVRALQLGKYDLFHAETELNFPLGAGSLPSGCSAIGRVKLNYVMAGKQYHTPNYTAYTADVPVDVFDASMDFFSPTADSGMKRIDLGQSVPTKPGKEISYEFEMLAGNTSTAKLVNFTRSTDPNQGSYARVFIDPGNTTYGDVIKFKITAFEADNRAKTESVRRVEIRIEPALTAQPEYQTVINTSGEELYFARYNYGGQTAAAVRSGYLAMAGASALHFTAPGSGDVQSFKELPLYNADQRVYMRPTQLALLGKHDREGNEKLFPFVQLTNVLVENISISPASPRVGGLLTLTIRGERLPANLAVTVPNCTGLQEYRSSGNIAKNNYATGLRVYECTASAPGTNLTAYVGPNNTPYVFSIDPATSCPAGQVLQGGVCVAAPMSITSISPPTAVLNVPTEFTVVGVNLPLTSLLVTGTFEECLTPVNRTSTGFKQTCTPRTTTGSKLMTVLTNTLANGGVLIAGSPTVVVTAAPSTKYSLVGNYSKEECVKDNTTGLIWEGKTATGPRAGGNRYTNYDDPTQGQIYTYSGWVNPTLAQINASTNSVGYKDLVNSGGGLCGFQDWRLPTKDELLILRDMAIPTSPKIDTQWFPNTNSDYAYWSSSPYVGNTTDAWLVGFYNGYVSPTGRVAQFPVRLVRASQ